MPPLILVAAVVVGGALTLIESPRWFFYMDDFIGIQQEGNLLTFAVSPYGGHLSFSSASVWFAALATFGSDSYTPFLLLAIVATALNAVALYVAMGRVAGRWVGACGASWLMFLGPAFHNQLWAQASLSQLASVAVMLLALLNSQTRHGLVLMAAVAVLGFGIGGLGVGVGVAFLVLLLMARRWTTAALGLLILAMGVIAAYLSARGGSAAPGSGLTAHLLNIPGYMLAAVQETLRVGLGATAEMAGALTVAGIAACAWGIRLALSRPSAVASRLLAASLSYLLTTWFLTGLIRGLPEEVAAPRYVGVTAPLVAVAIVSSLTLLSESSPRSTEAASRGLPRAAMVAVSVTLIAAAAANGATWIQARKNSDYLGALNTARLTAIHAGSDWIAWDFAPQGEGLTYVRAGAIEAAWSRHGLPPLTPAAIKDSGYVTDAAAAFLTTAVEAGVVQFNAASVPEPSACTSDLLVRGRDTQRVLFTLVAPDQQINLAVSGLPDVSVPLNAGLAEGVAEVRPLKGFGPIRLQATDGCLQLQP